MASNRSIADATWTSEVAKAWNGAQDLVAHVVTFSYPHEGYAVVIFPDTSNEYWGSFLTHVPQVELDSDIVAEDRAMSRWDF